jgi:hypothetical protein
VATIAAILFAGVASAADVVGTARLIRERRSHTATSIGGGKILVAGGQNLSGPLADVEIFDATTGTFTVAARLLTPRAEHTATRLADGRVFLIGGRGGEPLTSTEFYDATRNVFSSGPSLNSPRFGHTATLLPDGRLVVIGGNAAGTAEIFDPRANTFTSLAYACMWASMSPGMSVRPPTSNTCASFAALIGFLLISRMVSPSTRTLMPAGQSAFLPSKMRAFLKRS